MTWPAAVLASWRYSTAIAVRWPPPHSPPLRAYPGAGVQPVWDDHQPGGVQGDGDRRGIALTGELAALLAVAQRGQSGNLGVCLQPGRGHPNDDTAARPRSPLGAQAEGIVTWTGHAVLRGYGGCLLLVQAPPVALILMPVLHRRSGARRRLRRGRGGSLPHLTANRLGPACLPAVAGRTGAKLMQPVKFSGVGVDLPEIVAVGDDPAS